MAVVEELKTTSVIGPIFVAAGCLLFLSTLWSAWRASKLSKIPGPWYTRFTRLPLKLAIITGRRCYFVHDLHSRYGKIVRLAPEEVSVADAEGFKRIYGFKSEFSKARWYEDLNPFPRVNVFWTFDKQLHAKRRKLYARSESKVVLRNEWEPIVRSKCELAVQRILEQIEKNGKTDVLLWLLLMASYIIATMSFGEDFARLDKGEKSALMNAVTHTMEGAGIFYEMPLVRLLAKYLPIEPLRLLYTAPQVLLDYGEIAVKNARRSTGKKNIFTNIVGTDGSSLDDMDIRLEAIGQLIAGGDTTAITITYLYWCVLSRPKLREDLEAEVADLPSDFNDARLEKLPLLNAIIDEALRLYAAAQCSLPRQVAPAGAVLGGYQVATGTTVSSQAYTFHRDPEMYSDPLKFNPYRWLGEVDKSSVVYFPFGAGSRMCLGSKLARMELRYMTAMLFRTAPGKLKLAASVTDKTMAIEDYFIMPPVSHQCELEFVA